MKNDKENILNKSIRKVTWPNFCEDILEDFLYCYTIGQVLNLTEEQIRNSGFFTKTEIMGICNTLISLDSNLFYNSPLYSSLLKNEEYKDLIGKLNKTSKVSVNL